MARKNEGIGNLLNSLHFLGSLRKSKRSEVGTQNESKHTEMPVVFDPTTNKYYYESPGPNYQLVSIDYQSGIALFRKTS